MGEPIPERVEPDFDLGPGADRLYARENRCESPLAGRRDCRLIQVGESRAPGELHFGGLACSINVDLEQQGAFMALPGPFPRKIWPDPALDRELSWRARHR